MTQIFCIGISLVQADLLVQGSWSSGPASTFHLPFANRCFLVVVVVASLSKYSSILSMPANQLASCLGLKRPRQRIIVNFAVSLGETLHTYTKIARIQIFKNACNYIYTASRFVNHMLILYTGFDEKFKAKSCNNPEQAF